MFEEKGKNREVERLGGGRRRAAAPPLDDWRLQGLQQVRALSGTSVACGALWFVH